MVHEPEWRSRIAPQLPDVQLLREPDRTLIALLAATPATVAAAELLGRLEGEARLVLTQLLGEPWGQLDVDAIVSGALNLLTGRGLKAQLREIKRRLPLAPESDKPALISQVDALSRRLAELTGRWPVILQGGRVGS
jgi:hypothetical protein